MIHYMTTRGVGDAWVGNELRIVAKAGIPVQLHALKRPQILAPLSLCRGGDQEQAREQRTEKSSPERGGGPAKPVEGSCDQLSVM